jgi:hypothetical protein
MATSIATLTMALPTNVGTFLELASATAAWTLPHHAVVAALRRRYSLLILQYCELNLLSYFCDDFI